MCGAPNCREKAKAAAAANAATKATVQNGSPIATVKTKAFRGPGRPPSARVVTNGIRRK